MTKVNSFSRHEQQIRKEFRAKISASESSEDVKKIFVNTFRDFMALVFPEDFEFRTDDVALAPEAKGGFRVSERLMRKSRFREQWESSDLPAIVGRLAESAGKRLIRHGKNLEKTESKMYHDRDAGGSTSVNR